jgi:hypothetical protein
LAQSLRYLNPRDDSVVALYGEAQELFGACNAACSWNRPWVEFELSDALLNRREFQMSRQHAGEGIRLALSETGATTKANIEHMAQLSYEIVPNCLRVRADCLWAAGHRSASLQEYRRACLFAFVFQYWPHAPDEYTIAFYGEMVARTIQRIEEWRKDDPSGASDAVQSLIDFAAQCYELPIEEKSDLSRVASIRDLIRVGFAPRPEENEYPNTVGPNNGERVELPGALEDAVKRELAKLGAELGIPSS